MQTWDWGDSSDGGGGGGGGAYPVSHVVLCAPPGAAGAPPALFAAHSARLVTLRTRDDNAAPCMLRAHTGRITCLRATQDGSVVATAALDRTVRVWHGAADGGSARVGRAAHVHVAAVCALAPPRRSATATGVLLASGAADGVIRVGDHARGVSTLRGHGERIAALEWAQPEPGEDDGNATPTSSLPPSCEQLLSVAPDSKAKLWDVATAACVHTWKLPSSGAALSLLLPPGRALDGAPSAFAGGGRALAALDLRCRGITAALVGDSSGAELCCMTAHGDRYIVTGHADGAARVWDSRMLPAATMPQWPTSRVGFGSAVATLRGHCGAVTSVVGDGHKIVTAVREAGALSSRRRRDGDTLPRASLRVWCGATHAPRGALALCALGGLSPACAAAAASSEEGSADSGCHCGVASLAARGGLIAAGTTRGTLVTSDSEEALLPHDAAVRRGGALAGGASDDSDMEDVDDGAGGRFWLRAPAAVGNDEDVS